MAKSIPPEIGFLSGLRLISFNEFFVRTHPTELRELIGNQ
jgi:hypothetical protein